jgi:hypothetical protein
MDNDYDVTAAEHAEWGAIIRRYIIQNGPATDGELLAHCIRTGPALLRLYRPPTLEVIRAVCANRWDIARLGFSQWDVVR